MIDRERTGIEVATLCCDGYARAMASSHRILRKFLSNLAEIDPDLELTPARVLALLHSQRSVLHQLQISVTENLRKILDQKAAESAKLASKHLAQETGVQTTLKVTAPPIADAFGRKVLADLKSKIRPNETIGNVVAQLKRLNLPKRLESKTSLTVSTETNKIYNDVKELGAEKIQESKPERRLRKIWDATIDGRLCGECRNQHGQEADESGYVAGHFAPPMHPRCRCCWIFEWSTDLALR